MKSPIYKRVMGIPVNSTAAAYFVSSSSIKYLSESVPQYRILDSSANGSPAYKQSIYLSRLCVKYVYIYGFMNIRSPDDGVLVTE